MRIFRRYRITHLIGLSCILFNFLFLIACNSNAESTTSATKPSTKQTQPTATPIPSTTPSATVLAPSSRASAQIVYDDKMNSLLFFGGNYTNGVADAINDTWTWNGTNWTQLHPETSPPPRSSGSIAYDDATGQVVLFGGFVPGPINSNEVIGDTWVWDGTNWTQMHPAVSPPARAYASMTYDAATQQVILFGGGGTGPRTRNQSLPSLGDTWTWDGTNWTQQQPATSPPVRQSPDMTYDAATQNVVLFGGADLNKPELFLDTWTWDGSNWTQLHPATSPVLSTMVKGISVSFDHETNMTYNPLTQRIMLMCSGYDIASEQLSFESIWAWDGSNWAQQAIVGPDDSYSYGLLSYDKNLQAVIQFSSFLPKLNGTITRSNIFEDKLLKWNGHGWDTLKDWNK